MYSLLLASVVLAVCQSVVTITLPNGFIFDETKYLKLESRANYALEKCERMFDGCSNDCSASLQCDEFGNVQYTYPCDAYSPYCVKGTGYYTMCGRSFPMTDQACLTKAINSFICSDDGEFPDPTDCTKYHVCNGTDHHIVECPQSHLYYTDSIDLTDSYTYPGSGAFSCRFQPDYYACQCHQFYCSGSPNQFTFRYLDAFNYAYCVEIGTLRKTIVFKCPAGTRHMGSVSPTTGSVDCVPIGTVIV